MDILMLLLFIGFCIISFCIVLHCTQHFRCRCCIKYTYRISSYTTNSYTRNKHNRRSTNNSITINTPHRRSTNNMASPARVSNSMNTTMPPPVKQKWHHRTLSSLYENRFTASISSLRPSIHSFGGHDGQQRLIKRKCQFCLYGAEEDFDFFPSAFLLYLLFMIAMIITLVIRCVILHDTPLWDTHHHVSSIYDDVFLILLSTKMNASSFQQVTTLYTNTLYHMDWILAYCMMILSVWESLFNFYRYYTTMYAARYFYSIETKYVLRQFAYYLTAYSILFIANIHLYYWLFPITILSHFVFNTYCTFMFAHILVVQYKHIISTDSFLTDVHDEMLSSVYLMRKFSMFSCITSSIYIAVLLISYTVETTIYLPILWSLCALSFTLNFVRNRQFILRQFYKIHHCLIVKNFSCMSCCLLLCDRISDSTKNTSHKDPKNAKKSTAAENGNIADLKRQRKNKNNEHYPMSDHKRTHLKLRNESTLSLTTPTAPQIVVGHSMKNVINGTHRNLSTLSVASTVETLPTLKERGLTIKRISMISEISGATTIEEEEDGDDVKEEEEEEDDDDGTDIGEDADCLGTPSSVDISKVSTNDSPIEMMYDLNLQRAEQRSGNNLHTISITAPDAFKRNNAFVPTPIRTRSATLNTSSSHSIIEAANDTDKSDGEGDLGPSTLQKTQSDNFIRKSVRFALETDDETNRFAPYDKKQPNYRYYAHNVSPLVVKSCGHTPQSNNGGITLWNPPKQDQIPPIDLMLDIQYDDIEDTRDDTQTHTLTHGGEDADDDDDGESMGSDIMFHNDIHDEEIEAPTTPSRKCKALMLLGISSTESSVLGNRRTIMRSYGSHSSNKSKSMKMMSFRHKLSKSKSSVPPKKYKVPPHSNPPLFKEHKAMTKSSSQHLSKQYETKQKMKSTNLCATDDEKKAQHRRNVTMSNGHTPQSTTANNVSKHWYNEYIRSRQTNTAEAYTNKSFSKTLTQSELRDIVYEENDMILMETIKQQDEQQSDSIMSNNNYSIEPYIYTHNIDNTTGFGSTSYHSENWIKSRGTNTMSLNKRIFELLEVESSVKHKTFECQLQTSSLPPKIYDNYCMDGEEKAHSVPHDKKDVMVDLSQLKEQAAVNDVMLILDDDDLVDSSSSSSSSDDIEDEEMDFFPLDVVHMERLRQSMQHRYGMSQSLYDEMCAKPHSMSVSSKSVQSRRMMQQQQQQDEWNESVRKRRSRSMPSMEQVNNDSNDSLFDHGDDEQGDIVSLLSVLVQHGLYSKKNLNSVQQLTHYNGKP